VARKRLAGPDRRQPPRLDAPLVERTGDDVDPEELIEQARWVGGQPGEWPGGVEIERSVLSGLRLTGQELAGLVLLDVVFEECELSGATCTDARWERVVFRRCRMSGLVATELRGTDLRFDGCKLDQAWLRSASLDRCELVDCDLRGADLYGAHVTRSIFRRCDLSDVEVSASEMERVSLHGSTLDRLKGADALRGLTIGSDQLVPLAVPILGAMRIRVDDDTPDLVADDAQV
jgi:uncharacterized protein YjbI with pentapeptide repeats